ncbi:sensor histidine kinase [Nocardia sp. NPDC050710]|uniref:sensor histidine kinase n=1 Tax=Nocardia sp. NPDC050710 TaxID=3157220 RepID=UPI003406A33C
MDERWWTNGVLTGVLLIGEPALAALLPSPRSLDAFGAVLLMLATVPLVARVFAPLPVLLAHLAVAVPYHVGEYPHEAVVPATIIALYTVARYGNRRRTAIVLGLVVGFGVSGILMSPTGDENTALEAFGAVSWFVLACVAGEAVRLHRAYIGEVLDRAEQAERTRDEEARRQVAEERLRIARDLHDLLAHTITVIQVQAGVASHLVTERRADRTMVLEALETISGACSDARAELTATVGVLRTPGGAARAPLPALAQVPALAESAEAAGVTVDFDTVGAVRPLTPTVEMVGYRIVQEALTNVAKHASATRATVRLEYHPDRLIVCVRDNGCGSTGGTAGFGIRGLIERAEAIGGSAEVTGDATGFTVTAELPTAGPSGAPDSPLAASERAAARERATAFGRIPGVAS